MAIVLGNFASAKESKEMAAKTSFNAKRDLLMKMIEKAAPLASRAEDIFDTYCYIKKADEDFSAKLWNLLDSNHVGDINVNSCFSWRTGRGEVYISRYGVSFASSGKMDWLLRYYDKTQQELYSGLLLLKDFLNDFPSIREADLDKYIEELYDLISFFNIYADAFFTSVSNYEIVDYDK